MKSERHTGLLLSIMCILLTGCTCVKNKFPLTGNLGPYQLKTTVDSKYASYYVENYLAGRHTDKHIDSQFDSLDECYHDKVPQREELNGISKRFSVDFAALFWAHKLLTIPDNKAVQDIFVREFKSVSSGNSQAHKKEYVILLVPGLDYKNNGHLTGSDLKAQIEIMRANGLHVHFVEIQPLGTVYENAKMVASAITENANRKILIGGPSSAGPAIHLALSNMISEDVADSVAAWVNLGGVLKGSPVIDWMDSGMTAPIWKTLLWTKGWNPETFKSLRADVSRKRAENLEIPDNIKVINYIGLSLSGNISKFAMDKYCIMRSQGPNDGLAMLPDMVAPNSLSIIAPTSDHFFAEDPQIKEKTMAILNTVFDVL